MRALLITILISGTLADAQTKSLQWSRRILQGRLPVRELTHRTPTIQLEGKF
jgi:hypothetical protein